MILFHSTLSLFSDQGYGNDPDAGNPFRSQTENVDMIRSSLLQRNGLQGSSSSGLSGQTLSEREQSRANSISNFKVNISMFFMINSQTVRFVDSGMTFEYDLTVLKYEIGEISYVHQSNI